jgi:hypothetical protein
MHQVRVQTDWLAAVVAGTVRGRLGLIWAALEPLSGADIFWGLFMLFPLEGVRTCRARTSVTTDPRLTIYVLAAFRRDASPPGSSNCSGLFARAAECQ